MRARLIQVEQRIAELEAMASEIERLAADFHENHKEAQPKLSTICHVWCFGVQGILEKLYPDKV
jgi:hypothetical protein